MAVTDGEYQNIQLTPAGWLTLTKRQRITLTPTPMTNLESIMNLKDMSLDHGNNLQAL